MEKKSLQAIWSETDRPVIELMTKRTCQSPSALAKDSIDDNSDLESLDSYGSFVAVPKEFRPPLSVRSKIGHPKMSVNEKKQALSNQNPNSASKNAGERKLPKAPLLPIPKPATVERRKTANLTDPQDFKKNSNIANHPQKNDFTISQGNTNVKKNSEGPLQPSKKIPNNPYRKYNMDLYAKENGKNEIKYEYIERQKTIKLNFEMPSHSTPFSKDGSKVISKEKNLNQQERGKQVIGKGANKNVCYRMEQNISKGPHTVLYQKNKVKWVNSLHLDVKNGDAENKTEQNFGKIAFNVLHQENVVKWDSSLNLDSFRDGTEKKIEYDFSQDIHRDLCHENAIQWDNFLKQKKSSSDSEDEIEWTVIREKTTIVSSKKTEDINNTNKQIDSKCVPTKQCAQNKPEHHPRKHHRKTNFNRRWKPSNNYPRKYAQKPNHKDSENVHKNDLQLNNNLRHANSGVRNSNTRKESSLDAETFTRQCGISEQDLHSQGIHRSLSEDRPDFTINSNTRENIDRSELNSYSEKIDNITHKHLEDQRQSMLDYGREISDMIIGSHTALGTFISIHKEWKKSRLELISHFENLERNLKESSKRFTRYKEMLEFAKTGTSVAATLPIPHLSIAARVISVLTGLFSIFLSNKEKKSGEVEEATDISIAAMRDESASYDLYMYGLQCSLQFEDTAKQIKDFHSVLVDPVIFEKDSPEVAAFIRGVLEYKPRHHIFHKKLHKCFQELLQNSTSEFGRRFCEPFLLYSSDTIDVIEFLNWRFQHEDFNGESVRFEMQQIEGLIQRNDTSIKELTARVQTCIGILKDELKFLEGRVKDFNLFDKSVNFGM